MCKSDMTMSANRSDAPTIQKPGANTGRLCNPLLRESCLWSTLDPLLCYLSGSEVGFANTQIVQGFGGP